MTGELRNCSRDCSLLKVSRGVEVLIERLLASKRSIAVAAFEYVGGGVDVLTESLLAAKWPIALVALVH
jgi:hypothetical protein